MSDKNTSPPVKSIQFANGAISSGTDDSMSIETSSGQSAETKTAEDMKEYFCRLDAKLDALEDNFEQLTFDQLVSLGPKRLARRYIEEFQRKVTAAAGEDKQA